MIGNDITFIISISVFTFFAVMWVWKMKRIRTKLLPPAAVIAIIGIAVSAFIALLPAYLVRCDNLSMRILAVLRSVQHSIRLFENTL